jgi:hypothetical protein
MKKRVLAIQLREILSTMGPLPPIPQPMGKAMLERKKRDVLTKYKNHPNANNAVILIDELLLLEGQ